MEAKPGARGRSAGQERSCCDHTLAAASSRARCPIRTATAARLCSWCSTTSSGLPRSLPWRLSATCTPCPIRAVSGTSPSPSSGLLRPAPGTSASLRAAAISGALSFSPDLLSSWDYPTHSPGAKCLLSAGTSSIAVRPSSATGCQPLPKLISGSNSAAAARSVPLRSQLNAAVRPTNDTWPCFPSTASRVLATYSSPWRVPISKPWKEPQGPP
jgi:hypothetical protein